MFTIVAVPKPFEGAHAVHQRNAILSWHALPCEKQILLVGGEEGTHAIADEIGAFAIGDISKDSFGTPLLDSLLETVNNQAKEDVIVYVNADIILTSDIVRAIDTVRAHLDTFLIVARRWNIDLEEPIDFTPGWEEMIKNRVRRAGILFPPQGIDVFVFTKGQFTHVPPFAIGRSYWDNWFISHSRRAGYPVVDATPTVMTIHQNHQYEGFASMKEIRRSPQGRRNFYLLGDSYIYLGTTNDATHRLEGDELVKTNTKTVSVVIPHKGQRERLRACLRALTHQTYPRSFLEVIVVNNDPVAEMGSLALEFPFVKLCNEFTPGPAAARNTGAACAEGELFAFTDSDCLPAPDWITECVAALEAAPSDSFIAGAIQHRFQQTRNIVEAFDSVTFLQQERQVASHGTCVTANLFVDRAQFWRIGGFDEIYNEAAGEDWEWSQRASKAGLTVVYAPKAIVVHPAIKRWKDLRRKVQRIARGNARRWVSLNLSANPSSAELGAVGPPHFKKVLRRVVNLSRDQRISLRERAGAIGLQFLLWPWAIREWRHSVRQFQAHSSDAAK